MTQMEVSTRWPREYFACSARVLARRLLGALLVRRLDDGPMLAGRIVETEAYVGVRDAASHAFAGHRSKRNESMYARAGTAYVYFTYGMHHCFNVVCAREGVPEAVLIRALEPVEGLARMAELRQLTRPRVARECEVDDVRLTPRAVRSLCAGPARLCQALAITREYDGEDLVTSRRLFIATPSADIARPPARGTIIASPRIGIDSAAKRNQGRGAAWVHKPLRFSLKDHPCVSVKPKDTCASPLRRRSRN